MQSSSWNCYLVCVYPNVYKSSWKIHLHLVYHLCGKISSCYLYHWIFLPLITTDRKLHKYMHLACIRSKTYKNISISCNLLHCFSEFSYLNKIYSIWRMECEPEEERCPTGGKINDKQIIVTETAENSDKGSFCELMWKSLVFHLGLMVVVSKWVLVLVGAKTGCWRLVNSKQPYRLLQK